MALEAPTPLPTRASDEDRERAAQLLGESSAAGRISLDTYSRRLERAYEARSRAELGDLVSDLRPRGRGVRWLTGLVEATSALAAEAEAAWRRPRVPRLALPRGETGRVTIGRGPDCDCVVYDTTVSRRHAELRREDGGWVLTDLGSTNGTRLNGLRLTGEAAVRPGDEVVFGGARYRLGAS